MSNENLLSKEFIEKVYIKDKQSIRQIAKKCGVSKSTIVNKMKMWGIPARSNKTSEGLKNYWKKLKISGEKRRPYNSGLEYVKFVSNWYFKRLERSAEVRGLKFNLSIDYLNNLLENQKYCCALSGDKLLLTPVVSYATLQTASLDRIDSSKYYLKGNVQWIHKRLNIFKGSQSQEDLHYWALKIANNLKKNLKPDKIEKILSDGKNRHPIDEVCISELDNFLEELPKIAKTHPELFKLKTKYQIKCLIFQSSAVAKLWKGKKLVLYKELKNQSYFIEAGILERFGDKPVRCMVLGCEENNAAPRRYNPPKEVFEVVKILEGC